MNRFFILISLAFALNAVGQTRQAAWESNIAFNYGIKDWKLNSSIGHRTTSIKQGDLKERQFAFWEINQFITRSISPKISGSIGYKYRALDPTNSESLYEQRLTQQIALNHINQRIRLISRIRTEQRFIEANFLHRYRYRLSLDMPISGFKIDVREFYFVTSNEILMEFDRSESSIDYRLSIGIGYVGSRLYKVQVDLTHRMEHLDQKTDHVPFVHTSLIFNL
ncbi:DUF2490 domain-containing protein [Ekhidna sp.]|uniref:DUF2490 domain-containing protein n=1 Tax=Ekhidna sp. TaxID=2608089 RepID=UPI003C7E690A